MVAAVLIEKIVTIYSRDMCVFFLNKRFKGKEQPSLCTNSEMDFQLSDGHSETLEHFLGDKYYEEEHCM